MTDKDLQGEANEPKRFDKDAAIFNPSRYFKSPNEIAQEDHLTREEKIRALQTWKLDLALKDVAVEENMPAYRSANQSNVSLQDVSLVLEKLGVYEGRRAPPNKTG